jgi:putative endonuclease
MSTVETGKVGEDRAARVLRDAGMRIVERNYRCKLGELDAIARDGDTLVFVEVRTRGRSDRGDALETVGADKRRQIARVAQHYLLVRRPDAPTMRFDVIGITAGVVTHVRDAFRLGELR